MSVDRGVLAIDCIIGSVILMLGRKHISQSSRSRAIEPSTK